MQSERIRDLLRAVPFVPFRIVLSSGESYEIHNPELVVPMKSEVFVAFPDGERCAHVPLLHVSALETLRNGGPSKSKRRRK